MNNKGFTLIELMAVLVLIAIITVIGTVSVIGVQNSVKNDLWNSKRDLIEEKAKLYGEDNLYKLKTGNITIKVQDLLDKRYLTSKETCKVGDIDIKCVTNDTTGNAINNCEVTISYENNKVYAKLDENCQ